VYILGRNLGAQYLAIVSFLAQALCTALVFAIHHPLLFPPTCYYYRSAVCRASYLVEYVWSSLPLKPFVVFEYDQGQTKYGFGVGASNSSRGVNLSSTSLSPWGWLSSCCYAEWSVVSIHFPSVVVRSGCLCLNRLYSFLRVGSSEELVMRWGLFQLILWAVRHPPFDIG